MKKKKNNKISQSKSIQSKASTSSRGRPPKLFVSQKPKVKREGPGRPRKHNTDKTKQFQPRPIPEENKTKDAIILAMFLFSLLLFCFSIYIAQNKKQQEAEEIKSLTTLITTGVIENTGNNNGSTNIQPNFTTNKKEQILHNFYQAMNQQNFTEMNNLVDNNLKQSTIFRTYFSSKRLTRFINNINEKKVQYTDTKTQSGTISTISYLLKYETKNGSGYSEQRSATLIQKGDTYKIAKLMCSTPGCSKMPFFNPGKYNFK